MASETESVTSDGHEPDGTFGTEHLHFRRASFQSDSQSPVEAAERRILRRRKLELILASLPIITLASVGASVIISLEVI